MRDRAVTNPVFAFVAILWLGVLLGVSFLATPVKFQAPSLDLPHALEVGRVTFALLSKIEWGFFAVLLISALVWVPLRPSGWRVSGLGFLLAILLLQNLWLLPVLDNRAGEVMAGAQLAPTFHHHLYIAAEVGKAGLLLALSLDALRRWNPAEACSPES